MTKPIERKFYLPSQYVEANLAKYYILRWKGDHLIKMIDQSPIPYILHQGILYRTDISRDLGITMYDIDPEAQYKISFRLEKFLHQGIALIKLHTPNPITKVSYEHNR
jgi:hypothetical protein